MRSPERAILVVTHYQRLLNYIVPDFVHVLVDGRIVTSGGKELALELEEKGYAWVEAEAPRCPRLRFNGNAGNVITTTQQLRELSPSYFEAFADFETRGPWQPGGLAARMCARTLSRASASWVSRQPMRRTGASPTLPPSRRRTFQLPANARSERSRRCTTLLALPRWRVLACQLCFVNGRFAPALSLLPQRGTEGVRVASLAERSLKEREKRRTASGPLCRYRARRLFAR